MMHVSSHPYDDLFYSFFMKILPYVTTPYFQEVGGVTPQSLVRSGRISNSSEKLSMFSLPASIKKIRSKMKALEC